MKALIMLTATVLLASPALAYTASDDLWEGKKAVKEQPRDDGKTAPTKDKKRIILHEETETI